MVNEDSAAVSSEVIDEKIPIRGRLGHELVDAARVIGREEDEGNADPVVVDEEGVDTMAR